MLQQSHNKTWWDKVVTSTLFLGLVGGDVLWSKEEGNTMYEQEQTYIVSRGDMTKIKH